MPFELACPHCHRSIKARDEHVGKRLACPGCKQPFLVERPIEEDDLYEISELPASPALPDPIQDLGALADHLHALPAPVGFPAPIIKPAVYSGPLPDSRRYPALSVVRWALLILAAMVAIGWLISLVILVMGTMFAATDSPQAAAGAASFSVVYLIMTFFSGAITVCLLVAGSELIKVVLDIQENTLAAARR